MSMKSAIKRIVVFGKTFRTEREVRHGGVRAVIRHSGYDTETWPAVGASYERIAIAAVFRVVQFLQAITAYC